MSPRPDVSEERKSQIVEAAMIVFARSGFHEARMDDIAEEAGLSKGALYWYFDSKDGIITAIFENLFNRELAQLQGISDEPGSSRERLLKFVQLTFADLTEFISYSALFYEFYAQALRQEEIRGTLKIYLRSFLAVLTPLIEQGIARGELRTVSSKESAIAIGALIEGTILLWIYDPDLIDLEQHIESSFNLLFDGLKK
jgi:AcrR family transcriptional regulator